MSDLQIIEESQELKDRLRSEVLPVYDSHGAEFGRSHFSALKNKTINMLDELLPGEAKNFEKEMIIGVWSSGWGDSEAKIFWENEDTLYEVYVDSLLTDIQNGEYSLLNEISGSLDKGNSLLANYGVFIIHGHDGGTREKTTRFIKKLRLKVMVLSEQASQGKAIIEKLEHYTDVGFAIILYAGDDAGNTEAKAGIGNLNAQARQDMVFEHGLLVGRLGKNRAAPLISGVLELPNDIQGVMYIGSRS